MSPWSVVPFTCGLLVLAGAYLLWWLDRYRWEPLGRFVGTLVLGVAAGALSLVVSAWSGGTERAPALLSTATSQPLVLTELVSGEQALALCLQALLACLVLVLFSSRGAYLEGPLDGAVCGVAVAVGAALPMLVTALLARDVTFPWSGLFLVVLGASGGVALGALVGRGVLAGTVSHLVGWSALGALASAVLTIGGRAAWGASGGGRASWRWVELVAPLAALVLLVGLLTLVLFVERKVLTRQLAEEVEYGVLPSWAAHAAGSYLRRVRPSWWERDDERRALAGVMVSLAFKKEQLTRLAPEARNLYGLEVGRLRQRIRAMLTGVVATPAP